MVTLSILVKHGGGSNQTMKTFVFTCVWCRVVTALHVRPHSAHRLMPCCIYQCWLRGKFNPTAAACLSGEVKESLAERRPASSQGSVNILFVCVVYFVVRTVSIATRSSGAPGKEVSVDMFRHLQGFSLFYISDWGLFKDSINVTCCQLKLNELHFNLITLRRIPLRHTEGERALSQSIYSITWALVKLESCGCMYRQRDPQLQTQWHSDAGTQAR